MARTIYVIFSDTNTPITSKFDEITYYKDHIALTNVSTYVDWNTPGITEIGCDIDGDVVYNKYGIVYFDAVNKIVITHDNRISVIFERK